MRARLAGDRAVLATAVTVCVAVTPIATAPRAMTLAVAASGVVAVAPAAALITAGLMSASAGAAASAAAGSARRARLGLAVHGRDELGVSRATVARERPDVAQGGEADADGADGSSEQEGERPDADPVEMSLPLLGHGSMLVAPHADRAVRLVSSRPGPCPC
jgi:hypothetical protein